MNAKHTFAAVAAAASLLTASSSQAAILLTSPAPAVVDDSQFVISIDRGSVPASVSASQQGGAYRDNALNAVATVGSGSAASNFYELTITNGTGFDITGLGLSGSRIQYKDNSGNNPESATGVITGLAGATAVGLDVAAVSNNGDASSTVSSPPLTAPYAASLSTFTLANDASFTIRWTDTDSGGTDAMYGLAGLTITPVVVPEPAALGLLAIAGAGVALRRRRR